MTTFVRSESPWLTESLAFDYAVGLCCVWIVSGFFLDAWTHGHVPIESFFTLYHAVFYSGMLVLALAGGLSTAQAGARRA